MMTCTFSLLDPIVTQALELGLDFRFGLKVSLRLLIRVQASSRIQASVVVFSLLVAIMKTDCDYLYGWIKKMVASTKTSLKIVNPGDLAGNITEEKEDFLYQAKNKEIITKVI